MPLSNPVKRQHIHTREVRCLGYQRDDGLWDIEGRITDTKTYSFENRDRGTVGAGLPIHDMRVRLTIDDDLKVLKAEASTDSSPFMICPQIAHAVEKLEGLTIGKGWTKSVRDRLGGTAGCTHITQLLTGPLATAAYQTIIPRRMHARQDKGGEPNRDVASPPRLINTCHAFSSDGPVVKRQWPEHYTGS